MHPKSHKALLTVKLFSLANDLLIVSFYSLRKLRGQILSPMNYGISLFLFYYRMKSKIKLFFLTLNSFLKVNRMSLEML